jgi:ABC-2 type transport system permease protein
MTTTVDVAAGARPAIPRAGTPGLRLIHSEIYKIFSTNTWWLFGIASLVISALTLWANLAEANFNLDMARDTTPFEAPEGVPAEDLAQMKAQFAADHDLHAAVIKAAGSIYTSGQFFGLLLVFLLTALVMTNEFQYQTATATFLTTPRRTRVIVGKLIAGVSLAMLFWFVTEAIDIIGGLVFFNAKGVANGLDEWSVQRAILFNALAYLLWAILGVGLGTLIRSQIGSIVTCMVIYLVGFAGTILVFSLIREYLIHGDWVLTAAVSMPPIASQVMISPTKLYDESAAWWVGVIVMLAWSVLAGGIGVLLTRRRDIS